MSTVKDLLDKDQLVWLVGPTSGIFSREYSRRIEAIRIVVFKEQGLDCVGGAIVANLDVNAPLGPETEALFQELKTWLSTSPYLKPST